MVKKKSHTPVPLTLLNLTFQFKPEIVTSAVTALRLATEHIRFIHFSFVRLLPSRLVPARRVPGLTVLEFLNNLWGLRTE